MFYEELYIELGKLFYAVAAIDGIVQPSERQSLQKLVQNNWKPLEGSTDTYGTDQANLISFSFDYEEAEYTAENGLQSFLEFYRLNRDQFTPLLTNNILQTAKAIAGAYRGKNKSERSVLDRLMSALDN
jgi:tellurite resistance protein